MSCSWGPATPALSAGTLSAHGVALRGPGHRATDRSPHGTHASTHHRGSQHVADRRSAPGSSTVPSAGPFAVRDAARASRSTGPRRSRRAAAVLQRVGPAHSAATRGGQQASPASGVARDGRHASARSRLDTQADRSAAQHFAAAPGRSLMVRDRADARSLAPHNHARAGPRSPPAR
jgi:hypothetical protein